MGFFPGEGYSMIARFDGTLRRVYETKKQSIVCNVTCYFCGKQKRAPMLALY
jgi:hypothetical protein